MYIDCAIPWLPWRQVLYSFYRYGYADVSLRWTWNRPRWAWAGRLGGHWWLDRSSSFTFSTESCGSSPVLGTENTAMIKQLQCVPFESSLCSNPYCVKCWGLQRKIGGSREGEIEDLELGWGVETECCETFVTWPGTGKKNLASSFTKTLKLSPSWLKLVSMWIFSSALIVLCFRWKPWKKVFWKSSV